MTDRWRAVSREPLVHFVVAGALLFGVDRYRASRRNEPSSPPSVVTPSASSSGASPLTSSFGLAGVATGPIVVDAAARRAVLEAFVQSESREPEPAEFKRALDGWVEEEILFREGVRRGLERDDPRVRERVAGKLLNVLRASIVVPEPTDAELRAHHAAHPERWDKPALVDFVQVFVDGRDAAARERAKKLLATLATGADPAGMGDTFQGGRRYRLRPIGELGATFGPEFVKGLADDPVGQWSLRESRYGLHLVRIEKRTKAETPTYADVQADVAGDLFMERRDAQLTARLKELRAQHEVKVIP